MSYRRYWGKAERYPSGDSPGYHLLPYHCLDVAAVGWSLLESDKPLCKSLANQLDVKPEWLRQWFSFCLMLHDIGKFCRGFQNLAPNLSPDLVPVRSEKNYDIRHDSLGFKLWQTELRKPLAGLFPNGKTQRATDSWLEMVCGHHGIPPKAVGSIRSCLVPEEDIPAAETFVRAIAEHWLPDLSPLGNIDKTALKTASWQLAGVAVLADWLGSDQSYFHYHSKSQSLLSYWQGKALPAAEKALANSEFQTKPITTFQSIKQQFDFIQQPTPLQEYAEIVEIPHSPQLFILEDVTGAGKTEAAMVLAHRLMSQGLAEGLYVGLPTMATANGMYQRLSKSYRSLFQGEPKPSLVLAHGASKLSEDFQETIQLSGQQSDRSYQKDDQSASAYCNQWLADGRKKALLADVGVGTIDQALLAVLPARHQSLRMLGLKGKVLLLDEVHAYDAYMRQLLAGLLQAHAAQGGSVLLLSATLPQQFRAELLGAYLRGRGFQSPVLQPTTDYPLVSHCSDAGFSEQAVPTRDSVKRVVKIKRVSNPQEALELMVNTAEHGHCICWIRNTVKDARQAYQALQNDPRINANKLTLFHSRFAMVDRQSVEGDVLGRFGKASTPEQRAGQILIATQVVEQSLDLDFDVMVSDLAPVDLLIQRAGRLQRHNRDLRGKRLDGEQPDQRSVPCLYLHAPDPEQVNNEQWLRSVLPGTQSVYSHVGQLFLTAKLLLKKQGFSMPEDARELIEGVYGEQAQENIPEVLLQQSDKAEADDNARRNMGGFNCLKMEAGYNWKSGGSASGWDEDTHIPTRLNETETIVVTLVVVDESNNLQPWAKSDNPDHRWPLQPDSAAFA